MSKIKEEGFEDDVSLSPSPPPSGSNDNNGSNNKRSLDEYEDDDDYEDSLDLDMSGAGSNVWLVRLPKFLLDRWKSRQHNGETLGKVKIRKDQQAAQKGGDWGVRLELNDDELNQDLPQNYDIRLTKKVVDNTYIFTEKDMPKYKNKRPMHSVNILSAEGQSAERAAREEQQKKAKGKQKYRKFNNDTYVPFVKTIPKKTALVGTVVHECSVQPDIHDPNYGKIISERKEQLQTIAPTRERITLLENIPGVNAPTLGGSMSRAGPSFIRAQKRDPKNTDGKATRIPKNELLDMLFKMFEEYDYWTMKGLRERTHQPESYLKETLETMATLNKRGPYAMKYSLKPEFKTIKGNTNSLSDYLSKQNGDDTQATATTTTTNGTNENNNDEEEDEDEEMETVDLT